MAALRDWCRKCFHGEPAVIGKAVLQAPELRFIRTAAVMNKKAIEKALHRAYPSSLASFQIGSKSSIVPFLAEGICWWSSQDLGARWT